MYSPNSSRLLHIFFVIITIAIIHFLIPWSIDQPPLLAESYYDEAVTEEMALHILKGEPQLLFWGQPYMRALEAYPASFLFISLCLLPLPFT